MEKNFRLKATKDFIDLQGRRNITQGVEFFDNKERALAYVAAEVADILERPKDVTEAVEEPLVEQKEAEDKAVDLVTEPVVTLEPEVEKVVKPKKVVAEKTVVKKVTPKAKPKK